ncbi:hypothetical protein J2Y63_006671 [Shinella sp. BE166]
MRTHGINLTKGGVRLRACSTMNLWRHHERS